MTFDPIKTVEALNVEIFHLQGLSYSLLDGLTPCQAYQLHTLIIVRDAIMVGIVEDPDRPLP